jgi:hypothetical protein
MKNPSTHSLDDLPSIDELIRISKAIALLDAILSPDWEYRYYSFNSKWALGEMMASMRNGSGDEYFILFDSHGAAIKGFDHESDMSPWRENPAVLWPGMYDSVPAEFGSFLNEPAFSIGDVTFCVWRRYSDDKWQCGVREFSAGEDPDGSGRMLKILDGDPMTYEEFARDYHEVDLPLSAIQTIYEHKPLTDDTVKALNGELTVADVESDALEIGYPHRAV